MSMNDVARLKDINNLAQQTAGAIGNMPSFSFGALPVFSLGSSSAIVNGQAFYATLVAGDSTAGGDSTVDESQLLDRNLRFADNNKVLIKPLADIIGKTENSDYLAIVLYFSGPGKPYIKSNPTAVRVSTGSVNDANSGTVQHYFMASACREYYTDDFSWNEIAGTVTIAIDASDGYKSDQITFTITE